MGIDPVWLRRPEVQMRSHQAAGQYFAAHAKYPPTREPSLLDIAWAAGIWEGEGHIRKDSRTFSWGTGLVVSVAQKDTEILHRLQELFGGRVYAHKNSVCSDWMLTGFRAADFAGLVFTFLSQRRKMQVLAAFATRR